MNNNIKKNFISINLIFLPIVIVCIFSTFLNGFDVVPFIIGIVFFIIYLIFMYGEIINYKSYNTSNFNVQSDGTNLIIDYNNDRFTVEINSFNYLDEEYKKATGKSMNIIVKESLISKLKKDYWYYIKKIPKENLMNENSILSYFNNLKEANDEDKNFLLEYTNINKIISSKIPNLIVFFIIIFILGVGAVRSFLNNSLFNAFSILLVILVILIISINILKTIFTFLNFSNLIKKSRIYITECQVAASTSGFPKDTLNDMIIEFKYLNTSKQKNCSEVIIKSESNYYLNRWFAVGKKIDNNIATLYIINDQNSNKNEFILITK